MTADSHQLARNVKLLNRRLIQERLSDLTPTQQSVLEAILKLGTATPSAIAAHERVQPPSVTRTLGALVESGYVLRTPHPVDGRQVLVTVSESGNAALAAERDRRDLWLARRLEELDESEREILRQAARLMERISEG